MPNSQPHASGTKRILQRDIFAVSPTLNALIAGSQAAPQSVSGQMPAAPRGNELTMALAQGHRNMTPQQRAKAEDRADWQVHAYGTLARKPDLTFQDVIAMAAQSVTDKKATPEEASAAISGLPQNPIQLRQAIQQHFVAAIINASLLSGSKQQAAAPQQGAPANLQTGAPGMGMQSQMPGGMS